MEEKKTVEENLLGELGIEAPVAAAPAPVEESKPEVVAEPVVEAPKPVDTRTPEQIRIAESREALKHPLAKGQKFFESPEGYIVVGEADRDSVWCRAANNGRGMNINPRR